MLLLLSGSRPLFTFLSPPVWAGLLRAFGPGVSMFPIAVGDIGSYSEA